METDNANTRYSNTLIFTSEDLSFFHMIVDELLAGLIANGEGGLQGDGGEALKRDLARTILASARPGKRDAASLKQLVMRARDCQRPRTARFELKLQCESPVSLQMVESVPRRPAWPNMPLGSRLDPRQANGKIASPSCIVGPSVRGEERVFTGRQGGFSSGYQPFPIVPAAPLTVGNPSPRIRQRRRSEPAAVAQNETLPGTVLPIARHLYWSVPRRGADRLRPVVDDTGWFGVAGRHLGSTLVLLGQRFNK
jgi:hypothetical protein